MARPTGRGYALVGVATAAFVAARVVGTWELYVLALSFATLPVLAWAYVSLTARRLHGRREVSPARPTAGDPLSVAVTVENRGVLPAPQITAPDPAGAMGDGTGRLEMESLPPHRRRVVAAPPQPARRGVHRVAAFTARAEDPLGLARAARRLGEPFDLTIYPRLAQLASCVLFPGMGTRRERGLRGPTTLGASEFRGVRPHQPGEPLSHVDWKATAKTGELMLREMDDPTSGDVTVILDAPATAVAGSEPDTSLELAVQVTGSVADFALRAGRAVSLLLPQDGFRRSRLTPGADGRARLLEDLARVAPHSGVRLGASLRTLVAHGRRRPSRSIALVTLTMDDELVQALLALRDEGLHVAVVHVDAASFAGADRRARVATGAPASGSETGAPVASPAAAHELALTAGGVRCLTLGRGADLRVALSELGHQARRHDHTDARRGRVLVP
jgi:uncharacterized protein (DUF58 family)